MEFEINKGVSKTELNVTLTEVTQFDEFRYRMIKENSIPGILSCIRNKVNDITVYAYDITGMQSIAMRFEGKKFTKQDIQSLYINVISTLLKSEEYFLDKNCFLLSEELIQYEESSATYQLAYCPEAARDMKSQLADLTEYVLNHTEYSDKPAVTLIYEVFQMMRDDHTTILEVLTFIKEGRKQNKVSVMERTQPRQAQMGAVCQAQPFVTPINQQVPPQAEMPRQQMSGKAPSMEKQAEEKESSGAGFSTKKLLLCMGAVAAGTSVFLALYLLGFLFISHTKRLDLSKFGGVILLIAAVVLYVCYKVFGMKEEKKEKSKAKKDGKPKKEKKKVKQPQAPQQPVMQAQPRTVQQPAMQPQPRVPQQPAMQPQPRVPEHPVMQPRPRMQQMPAEEKQVYRLVAEKETHAEQFILCKYPYLLGKSYEQVDGVIYSDAVSKVHAEFVEESGQLYIMDMSSTNGTYVNRKRIASNQRVAVESGDHIRIADKEYLLCS